MAVSSLELAESVAEMRSNRPYPEDWTGNDVALAWIWSEVVRLSSRREEREGSWSAEVRSEFTEHDRGVRNLIRHHSLNAENEPHLRRALHRAYITHVAWRWKFGALRREGFGSKREVQQLRTQVLRILSKMTSPQVVNRLRIAQSKLTGRGMAFEGPISFVGSALEHAKRHHQMSSALKGFVGTLDAAAFGATNQLAQFESTDAVRLCLLTYWSHVEARKISNARESRAVKFLIDCFRLLGIDEKSEKQIASFSNKVVSEALKAQEPEVGYHATQRALY